jgi:DNA-binding transcriptional ArsR family regulator
MNSVEAAQGFSAMGSESRLEVLKTLVRAGEAGLVVNVIQSRTGIPASTLTHHLKFLGSAGLIEQQRKGRSITVRANYDHLRALADFILAECCAEQGRQSDE